MTDIDPTQFKTLFDQAIDNYASQNQYGVSKVPSHIHNGTDSLPISDTNTVGNIDSLTSTINLNNSPAPTSGQVLTAIDSTHANWQSAGISSNCGTFTKSAFNITTTTIAHGLGKTPISIKFDWNFYYNGEWLAGNGVYTSSSQNSICYDSSQIQNNLNNSNAVLFEFNSSNSMVGNVTVNSTNIIINWTAVGTLNGGTFNILWQAIG